MYTRRDFAKAFLRAIDAPITIRNMRALLSWMQAEGNAGKYNPLNTTMRMYGSTPFNFVGVQNYITFEQGVRATADTLNYGADKGLWGYYPIRRRLRRNAFAYWTLRAVENSNWGTGGLALRCLPWVKRSYEAYADKLIAQ